MSVISWAESESELDSLKARLSEQDFDDYELVPAVGGSFDRAINRALPLTEGEYIIYVDKDARLFNGWMESVHNYISEKDKAFFVLPSKGIGESFGIEKRIFIETPMEEGRIPRDILYRWFYRINKKYLVDFEPVDVIPVIYGDSIGYNYFYRKGYLDAEWNNLLDCGTMSDINSVLIGFVHSFILLIGYLLGKVMYFTNDKEKFKNLEEPDKF